MFGLHNTYLSCNPEEFKRCRSQSPLQALSTYGNYYRYQKVIVILINQTPIPELMKYIYFSILNKYPGFPQAESLSYPMATCRRLASLLKQSNSAYPPTLRTMTGLEVGWLQRV